MASQASVERAARPVEYPESDGKPMGETDFHIAAIVYLRQALQLHFRSVGDLYVAADLLLYYEEGEPKSVVVPDVFVARGVGKGLRRTYKLWEERVAPCVVFEVTSRASRLEDQGTKRALYEMLGVGEYFLFDPLGEYLSPRLQGYRLVRGRYQPVAPASDDTMHCKALGLTLRPQEAMLRLVDPTTGRVLPTLDEAADQAAAEMMRAEREAARAESEAARAESETARAESETARANREAVRAERAEAEVAYLRAELERLRRS